MAPVVFLRCVSPGRRLELLAPTASLLRTVWTVSSCNCRPGETQRRDTTGRHNRKMMQNEKEYEDGVRKNTEEKTSWLRDLCEETSENGLIALPKNQEVP